MAGGHEGWTPANGGGQAILFSEIKRLDELRTADREHVVQRLADQDELRAAELRHVDQRFDDQEKAVAAALAAAKEAVAAALAASEKGVEKAEAAQRVVNASQNEFRGALDDQTRTLMPRAEAENTFRELRDLIAAQRDVVGELRSRIDVGPPSLSALQAQASGDRGRRAGSLETRALIFAVIGALGLFAGLALALAR